MSKVIDVGVQPPPERSNWVEFVKHMKPADSVLLTEMEAQAITWAISRMPGMRAVRRKESTNQVRVWMMPVRKYQPPKRVDRAVRT